jgi:hypothetical protein
MWHKYVVLAPASILAGLLSTAPVQAWGGLQTSYAAASPGTF